MWACRCHWQLRDWRGTGNIRNTFFSQRTVLILRRSLNTLQIAFQRHVSKATWGTEQKTIKLRLKTAFLPRFLANPLGCDWSHRHIVFRSEFHFKLRNREDSLRLVFVSEAGRVARPSFFRGSFTRACPRVWAIARLIETWGCSGIGRAYVPPGCTDVVKPILYRAAHRRGVPPTAGNLLNTSDVSC